MFRDSSLNWGSIQFCRFKCELKNVSMVTSLLLLSFQEIQNKAALYILKRLPNLFHLLSSPLFSASDAWSTNLPSSQQLTFVTVSLIRLISVLQALIGSVTSSKELTRPASLQCACWETARWCLGGKTAGLFLGTASISRSKPWRWSYGNTVKMCLLSSRNDKEVNLNKKQMTFNYLKDYRKFTGMLALQRKDITV